MRGLSNNGIKIIPGIGMMLMNRVTAFFTTFLLLLYVGASTHAASFECAKAASEIERQVCDDPELSQLDEELAQTYTLALSKTDDHEYIREWQRYWLSFVRENCHDTPCLNDAYGSQILELREHAEVLMNAGASVSGMYERYYQGEPDTDEATLLLLELRNHHVRLLGDAFWIGDADIGAIHAGHTGGVFAFTNGTGQYHDAEDNACGFIIIFHEDGLRVSEDTLGCGGLNVSFNGEYRKIGDAHSSKTSPRFIERTETTANEFDENSRTYPELIHGTNSEQQARLNAHIRELVGKTDRPIEQTLLTGQDIDNAEKEGQPFPYLPYSSFIEASIQHYDERFLSIEIFSQGYTGGAHGWYASEGFTYDLQADREVRLQDLFQAGAAYRAKILHAFFKMLQDDGEPELDSVLFNALEPNQPEFAQEFTLSASGLTIILPNIFPHVIGSLRYLEIPWEDLQGYLKPDIYTYFTGKG